MPNCAHKQLIPPLHAYYAQYKSTYILTYVRQHARSAFSYRSKN